MTALSLAVLGFADELDDLERAREHRSLEEIAASLRLIVSEVEQ